MKREEALKITALAANLLFVHGQMNSSSRRARCTNSRRQTGRRRHGQSLGRHDRSGSNLRRHVAGRGRTISAHVGWPPSARLDATPHSIRSPWRGFAWRHFRYTRCDEFAADRGQCRRRRPRQALAVYLQQKSVGPATCAAFIAGIVAAVAERFQLSDAIALIGFCPCIVLVPGRHILNGAIDLARTRICARNRAPDLCGRYRAPNLRWRPARIHGGRCKNSQ